MSADNLNSKSPTPDDSGLLLDQAALDALFAAASMEEVVGKGDGDRSLGAGAHLDELLTTPKPEELVPKGGLEIDSSEAVIASPAASINQAEIDALLAMPDLDKPIGGRDLEGPVKAEPTLSNPSVAVSAPQPPVSPPPAAVPQPVVSASAADDGTLTQDFIDALIAAAGDESKAAEIMAKEPAPPAVSAPSASEGLLLTQDDLDAMVSRAQAEQKEKNAARQRAIAEQMDRAAAKKVQAPALPSLERRRTQPSGLLRSLAAVMAALIAGVGTFTYLRSHSNPPIGQVASLAAPAESKVSPQQSPATKQEEPLPPPSNPAEANLPHSPQETSAEKAETVEKTPVAPLETTPEASTVPVPPAPTETPPPVTQSSVESLPSPEVAQVSEDKEEQKEKPSTTEVDQLADTLKPTEAEKSAEPTTGEITKPVLQEPAVSTGQPVTQATNSDYEDLALICKTIKSKNTDVELNYIFDKINHYLDTYPRDPNLPQILRWKADVYTQKGIPTAAHDVYRQIIERFPNDKGLPDALMTAATFAYDHKRPDEAIRLMERYVTQFPDAEKVRDAELMLANAYNMAGRVADASALYTKLLQVEQPDSRVAAVAAAALGKIAADQERWDDTIRFLEPRMHGKSEQEGGDQLRWSLAHAYKVANRLEDARRTYNDLIAFYPDSPLVKDAFNELMPILEQLGKRDQAIQMAKQAEDRFPGNIPALQCLARLLRASGDLQGAADYLVRADEAGAKDPASLLAAAHDYGTDGSLTDARDTLKRLVQKYPDAGEAFEAKVELARILCDTGHVKEGTKQLESLAATTPRGPKKLPILMALTKAYRELDLKAPLAKVYREVAAISSEPQVLADAALALFDAGAKQDGAAVASRVDLAKLSEKKGYAFLHQYGQVMLESDAPRGMQLLETTRKKYPKQWTADDEKALFKTYLSQDNEEGARTLLSELREHVMQSPVDMPRLQDALITYADYLYGKNQMKEAADLYAQVIESGDKKDSRIQWAKYQRGGALVRDNQLGAGIDILDEVAVSDTPWANNARLKAENARLEQRLRGIPVSMYRFAPPKKTAGAMPQGGKTEMPPPAATS